MLSNRFNPEGELLLCCARTQIDEAICKRIRLLVERGFDWLHLLQIAEKHRMIPLLYHGLKASCKSSIPREIYHELEGRFYSNARKNFLLMYELFRLNTLFQNQGIRSIPYKGTILASSVYGKISFRQIWDIDFLVHEQDFVKCRELLISERYNLKESYDREQSFYSEERDIEVDIHWGITPVYFPVLIDFEDFWNRTKFIKLSGTNIRSFSVEDLLLLLCIQVAKDSWEKLQKLEHLIKVCDIAELIRNNQTLDWGKTFERTRIIGAERILHFGLFLARNLLNAPIPVDVLFKVQRDKAAVLLANQVSKGLFGEDDRSFAPESNSLWDIRLRFRQLIFYLRMRERFQHKLMYLWDTFRTLITINHTPRNTAI